MVGAEMPWQGRPPNREFQVKTNHCLPLLLFHLFSPPVPPISTLPITFIFRPFKKVVPPPPLPPPGELRSLPRCVDRQRNPRALHTFPRSPARLTAALDQLMAS